MMKDKISLLRGIFLSKIFHKPYKLNFAVTARCNSRCTTCNIWQVYRKNPKLLRRELNTEEINKIFKRLPKTIIWLSLTGGEPFLREDFDKIIISAIKNIPNLKIIGIPSNGIAQERIVSVVKSIMKVKHPRIMITFSIDGPEKIHNKIRGLNCYKTAWQTYTLVREITRKDKNIYVGIEITISKRNERYLIDYIGKLLKERHSITLTVTHKASFYHNLKDKNINPESLESIKQIISVFIKHKSIFNPQELVERLYAKNISEYLKNPRKQIMPCVALDSSIALNQYGDVLPCFMWGLELGNLRGYGYDLNKILNSEKARLTRVSIKRNKCPVCWTPCEAYQSIINGLLSFRVSPLQNSLH